MMPTQQSDSMTNVEGAKSAANAMMALGVENVPQAVSGPGCGGSQKSLSSVSNYSKGGGEDSLVVGGVVSSECRSK